MGKNFRVIAVVIVLGAIFLAVFIWILVRRETKAPLGEERSQEVQRAQEKEEFIKRFLESRRGMSQIPQDPNREKAIKEFLERKQSSTAPTAQDLNRERFKEFLGE